MESRTLVFTLTEKEADELSAVCEASGKPAEAILMLGVCRVIQTNPTIRALSALEAVRRANGCPERCVLDVLKATRGERVC